MGEPPPDADATSVEKRRYVGYTVPSGSSTASFGSYTKPRETASVGYGASGPGLFGEKLFAWAPVHRRASGEPGLGDSWAPGRPLRVVHVGPSLAHGGAESWLLDLTRFLDPDRLRIERTIVADPDCIDPGFLGRLPIPHEVGGAEAVHRAAADCDVLMAWGLPLDEYLNGGPRPPLCVYVAHGEGLFTSSLLERSLRSADHVVAVSERVRRHACNGAAVTVIPNGVDAARLAATLPRDEVRRSLGIGPDDFVLGYLGRLAPEKQPELIIEAAAGLPATFRVLMVGWGPLLPDLMALANRRIPGRCAFVTATDYLGDYYRAMDTFCLPSREEGAPLALIEAMMCGLPPIATPVGIVPEWLIDRVNGLVVEPSAESIRSAAELLRRHPQWAAGLAAEARALADRHGHAAGMARRYEDLIARLWATRPASPCPRECLGIEMAT